MKADDPAFGVEPESYHGTLTTKKTFDPGLQTKDTATNLFVGKVPSQRGSYMDYYRDLVAAIRGEKELMVKPEQSRDGIRLIELARESAERGVTVHWSDA